MARRSGIILAEFECELQHAGKAEKGRFKTQFDLHQSPSLRILTARPLTNFGDSNLLGAIRLDLKGTALPIECFSTDITRRFAGRRSRISMVLIPRSSPVEISRSVPLVRVNSGLLNLPHYHFGNRAGVQGFTLRNDQWIFEFTPVSDKTLNYPPGIGTKEYFFTHHLCMRKADFSSFSNEAASEQLSLVARFFSFCHGHWVSTALTYGVSEDGTVAFEQWGTGTLSPWVESTGWLDRFHGNCMETLFPGFARLMEGPEWRDAISKAIYWYIRSDTSFIGPDGACVLLQAAIERLAWHVIVRDRRCLSESAFSKIPGADRIRLLLSNLKIPLGIPDGLIQLQAKASELNWADGPEAFVAVRNRIVHPPKLGNRDSYLPYFDAYLLGKYYLELVVLSASEYQGMYSNRTLRKRWVGAVEPVPWASSSCSP